MTSLILVSERVNSIDANLMRQLDWNFLVHLHQIWLLCSSTTTLSGYHYVLQLYVGMLSSKLSCIYLAIINYTYLMVKPLTFTRGKPIITTRLIDCKFHSYVENIRKLRKCNNFIALFLLSILLVYATNKLSKLL